MRSLPAAIRVDSNVTEPIWRTRSKQLLIAIDGDQGALASLYRAKREADPGGNGRRRSIVSRRSKSGSSPISRSSCASANRFCSAPDQTRGAGRFAREASCRPFPNPREAACGATRADAEPGRRQPPRKLDLWIVSKQSLRFFRDMIDLIANGGRKAPVYLRRSRRRDVVRRVNPRRVRLKTVAADKQEKDFQLWDSVRLSKSPPTL